MRLVPRLSACVDSYIEKHGQEFEKDIKTNTVKKFITDTYNKISSNKSVVRYIKNPINEYIIEPISKRNLKITRERNISRGIMSKELDTVISLEQQIKFIEILDIYHTNTGLPPNILKLEDFIKLYNECNVTDKLPMLKINSDIRNISSFSLKKRSLYEEYSMLFKKFQKGTPLVTKKRGAMRRTSGEVHLKTFQRSIKIKGPITTIS